MATRTLDTGTDKLLCSVTDHVATITFNDPAKRNALGDELTPALRRMLVETEHDPDVRVVVLTGAEGAFCAGGDVGGLGGTLGGAKSAADLDARIAGLRQGQETVSLKIFEFPKPVICSLPGPAAGAGMSIALSCDLRIAGESGCLVPAFGRIGASGDYGGSWYLSHLVGTGRAKEIYFTGRRITAQEGLDLGIFNRVVPDADLGQATAAFAAELANAAPVALRYMKENHNRARTVDLRTALHWEADRMVRSLQTEDHKAAVQAFFNKKKPVFHGR